MIKNTLAGSLFFCFLLPDTISNQQIEEIKVIINTMIDSALKKDLDNVYQFNQFQKDIALSVAKIIEITTRYKKE